MRFKVSLGNSLHKARSLLENRPLEVPAEEAVRAQRIIEAAYRSNDERKIIDL